MMDDAEPYSPPVPDHDFTEPTGSLRRALDVWERQAPSRSHSQTQETSPFDQNTPSQNRQFHIADTSATQNLGPAHQPFPIDTAIEEQLRRHATRLSALEHVIQGDRRLDPPRFSLMMLNAFLGRAVTDGATLSRLPGLFSISERIDGELADLEFEYSDALSRQVEETDPTPINLRDELRQFFSDMTSLQKAQQRQVVTSLAALHTAIHDLRARLQDSDNELPGAVEPKSEEAPSHPCPAGQDDLARPLIDPERLVDPRPVLAAARAAASRANLELAENQTPQIQAQRSGLAKERPYRSVLLGSAVLGILMLIFGRDAAQLIVSAPLNHGLARH